MTINGSGVQRAFDASAHEYDAERRLLIPAFDAFYGNAIEVIRDWGGLADARVVDLGAGTGLFSAMVAAEMPDASFLLLDLSPQMLAQAERRFSGAGRDRIETAVFDLASGDLGGPWDLAISALAIHHIDDRQKQLLFARIYQALAPGGLFVNAEQVLGPTPEAEARNARHWHQAIREAGATDASVARAEERMRFDQPSTVEDQLSWLRAAGFDQVDCTFKAWRFAVLAAWKTS